jgi:hypothetical protein
LQWHALLRRDEPAADGTRPAVDSIPTIASAGLTVAANVA